MSRIDNRIIVGTSSDAEGNFMAENINENNVRIKFTRVGYQTKIIDSVSVATTSSMGLIRLRSTVIMLPEVVIKSITPMIEFNIDKQVVNIDQVPGSTGSITEALSNSGAVQIDPATNKITVRGQDVKIQMDGHPFDMPDNMLAQMPASMFDQVEVILSPSAKESAEGGAYILNLISKKSILDSYNGSISLNTSTNNRNYGGINFNYKKDKLNIFTALFSGFGNYKSFGNDEQINYNSTSLYHQITDGEYNYEGYNAYLKLGFDYNLDENNLLTFYGTYNKFKYDADEVSDNYVTNNLGLPLYSFNNKSNSIFNYDKFSLYGFYKKKFDKEGNDLTFDVLYTNIKSPSNSERNVIYSNSDGLPQKHNSERDETANTFISKIEYVYPSEIGKFETGYNFTYRNRNNDYNTLDYSYISNSWTDSLNLSNLFKYNEDIHAFYITYSNTFGKVDIKTGIRGENLHTKGEQITSNENFSKNFFNLFPNLNIAYKFNDMFQITFNTFRRVRYPQLYFVNPFKQYNGPNSFSLGNPELQPFFLSSYALSLSQFINVYYVYSTGLFNYVTSVIEDTITISSPINISNNKTYGIELTLPYYNTPTMPVHLPDFISMLYVQFGYTYRKQSGQYLNEDLNYSVYRKWLIANLGLKLWFDVNANLSFRYFPKIESTRSIIGETHILSLYFSKAFMDQKLQVNLSISDVLNSQKFSSQTYGSEFYSKNLFSQYRSRSVSIG
ncbi:MAG: TonB-dependent receptor, partial [Clostridiaceae bacterium]|nr:TonB-dependent receptor [Clostridiaceae bacterium]